MLALISAFIQNILSNKLNPLPEQLCRKTDKEIDFCPIFASYKAVLANSEMQSISTQIFI